MSPTMNSSSSFGPITRFSSGWCLVGSVMGEVSVTMRVLQAAAVGEQVGSLGGLVLVGPGLLRAEPRGNPEFACWRLLLLAVASRLWAWHDCDTPSSATS